MLLPILRLLIHVTFSTPTSDNVNHPAVVCYTAREFMRTHLQLMAILLASLGVVAQNAESPTTPSSNPPPEQPKSVSPAVPRTGEPSDHCTDLAKPPNPNNVATDRKNIHVSGGRLIKRVNPSYPAAARQARIQGTVVLCATINKDGVVRNVRPLFGPQELIPAAVEAAEQWRYEPYRVNKELVEVDSEIRMDFTLHR